MISENQPLRGDNDRKSSTCSSLSFLFTVGLTVAVIIAVVVVVIVGWMTKEDSTNPAYILATSVTVENIQVHLEALQNVSNEFGGGSRSVMTGYAASAKYVEDILKSADVGCDLSRQSFKTPIYTELSEPQLSLKAPFDMDFQLGVDFNGLRYGGNKTNNEIEAPVCLIENSCDPFYFKGIPFGCIALFEYNSTSCSLIDQAWYAEEANASAVIIYNKNLLSARVRDPGWFESDRLMTIPVITGTYSLGSLLKSLPNSTLHLITSNVIEITESFNVFCVTKEGDNKSVIVAGAHLDSVPEGPGLNDNGSGSSTLLEIVLRWYAEGLTPVNQIRFAWWGSEEVGLIGSRFYVKNLQDEHPEEFENIAMNLNFDMLASPNFYTGVHDGATAVRAQNASSVITSMFIEYFVEMDIKYLTIDLKSGSDFVPFVEAGIPSGGLASGAGSKKSKSERITFCGLANAPFDPCYHLSCDTTENINTEVLGYLSGAASYVIQKSAQLENLREYLNTPPEDIPVFVQNRPILHQETCEVE